MKKCAYFFKKSRILVKNRTNMKRQPLFCSTFVKNFEKIWVLIENTGYLEKVDKLFEKKLEKVSKNYRPKKLKFDFGFVKRRFFFKTKVSAALSAEHFQVKSGSTYSFRVPHKNWFISKKQFVKILGYGTGTAFFFCNF